jgi:dienelactone hydrolase
MAITTEGLNYCDGSAELSGIFVWDDAVTGKRPGILVIHGGAGLDDHAKGRARRMAEAGFIAFACDMYGKGVAGNREAVMARIMELRANPETLCKRARAGLDALAAHPQVDGRLAAIGYCFGGMTVLEMARSGMDLAGVVSVHGTLGTKHPAAPDAVTAKILVCHGALDPHVPMKDVTAFIEEMGNARADWQLIVYGGAMHGFTHENASSIPGVAYNALADARSAAAIGQFFRELFG